MTPSTAIATGAPSDLDLDALLADLPLDLDGPAAADTDELAGLAPEEEIIEPSEPELSAADASLLEEVIAAPEATTDELDASEELALDGAIGRMEAYEAQESEAKLSDDDEIEAAPEAVVVEKVVKPRKAKAEKAEGAEPKARVVKDLTALDPEHFQTVEAEPSTDAFKAALIADRPKQVKIAEKFDNVIASLAAGRKPSTYVMDCFAVLDVRKEVTNTDLVAALQAHDYSVGTSRSQAGQIMELFGVLRIAERSGQKLTLNPNSVFAAKLRALPA